MMAALCSLNLTPKVCPFLSHIGYLGRPLTIEGKWTPHNKNVWVLKDKYLPFKYCTHTSILPSRLFFVNYLEADTFLALQSLH